MKSTLSEAPSKSSSPVRLLSWKRGDKQFIILMIGETEGTVVYATPNVSNPVGHHSSCWAINEFQPLENNMIVNLQNEP